MAEGKRIACIRSLAYPAQVTVSDDQARIEQLEAELLQLKAKVDSHHPRGELSEANEADLSWLPRRARMVAVGAVLVLVSLGFFVAIYTALAKGFGSLATKAASSYTNEFPEEPDEQATGLNEKPHPSHQEPQAPAIPGL